MKIFTEKQYAKHVQRLLKEHDEYNEIKKDVASATLDYINALFSTDFGAMHADEIKSFFKYNPDTRMTIWLRGADVGIDSIVDAFAAAGMFKKHTLEKLRFRAHQRIQKLREEGGDSIYGE